MAESCLLIIDVQQGFINEWTREIPARVARLQAGFDHVVATRFYNAEGSFYRTLIGWHRLDRGSPEFALAFTPRQDALILDKAIYSCVSERLLSHLTEHRIARVHLSGIATDNCVLKSAVDLFEAGIEPIVLAEACASHGGPEIHDCALKLLRRFIGKQQVVEARQAP